VSEDFLIRAIPDIVAFVRPDGLITHQVGGGNIPLIAGKSSIAGQTLGAVFGPAASELLGRQIRRALASRECCAAEFSVDGAAYSARVIPQGPSRTLCIIRHDTPPLPDDDPPAAREAGDEFIERLQRSVAQAALRERPLALALIFLDGLQEIGELIDFSLGERVLRQVLGRLDERPGDTPPPCWHAEPMGRGTVGVVIDGLADSARIHDVVTSICESLSRSVHVHGAEFQLQPYAGVAILGRDASKARPLLERARAALFEARRSDAGTVQFYSDTVRLLPVLRVDIERELRKAVGDGQIDLRYVARHELSGGGISGIYAYMRWIHPLRGEIAPSEFLRIADATNLAVAVSGAVLARLAADLPDLRRRFGSAVPVSFGALRQHVTSGQLLRDWRRLLAAPGAPAAAVEFRISERTLASLNRPERLIRPTEEIGIRWVVDEIGRGFSSLATLAKLPLAGLQIDRSLVLAAAADPAAGRSCRAVFALAEALEVLPIAAGVDDEATRRLMLGLGCREGLGDLFPAHHPEAIPASRPGVAPAAMGN
jgi:predicted signal transduction protein with EAL and GGDEF domain